MGNSNIPGVNSEKATLLDGANDYLGSYDEKWLVTDKNNDQYYVYYKDGVPASVTLASGNVNQQVTDPKKISSAINAAEGAGGGALSARPTGSTSQLQATQGTLSSSEAKKYDEVYEVKDSSGKVVSYVYYKDGQVAEVKDRYIFGIKDRSTKSDQIISSIAAADTAKGASTTFSQSSASRSPMVTATPEGTEDSFSVDVELVEEVCSYLDTFANDIFDDSLTATNPFDITMKDFLALCQSGASFPYGGNSNYVSINTISSEIDSLRSDLNTMKDMFVDYANGKTDSLNLDKLGSMLRYNFKPESEDEDLNPDWETYGDDSGADSGPVPGPDNGNDDNISNVDTDIDTDVDVEPVPDSEPTTKPNISTSITGAGIGSTLLGMATGAAGVAGSGALIDGDSVLDELDDTVVVPSTIRNSTAASIRKSKKDKVGAAVGVGVAAAAAGAGLYYYSKKAEEEENGEEEINEEDAEKAILQDDNEDGAVEFQYVSGLGSVVELKDAIMNDTL